MLPLAWIIFLLPLFASLIIILMPRSKAQINVWISVSALTLSFILSWIVLLFYLSNGDDEASITWIQASHFKIEIGLRLDSMSLLMLLLVSGIGALVCLYSKSYMAGDKAYSRFFATLSFFSFSMLGLILSTNFLQMFIFWELVGLSSYLLIGFWFEKPSAADASKKAFLTNRLGDFGFLIGIMMVWKFAESLTFSELSKVFYENQERVAELGTLAGLLIFCGAIGKSAQFPLHIWLPDAMEGPTPVSALIHAATMVAAGVYMLCRVSFIFTPEALSMMAWVGALTAFFAALIALQQNDIKQILAHSTISQLGFMIMAIGVGSPSSAMFHLSTHACFKALLFLGAGSLIYAVSHKQDIWKMGGLSKKMPITYWTFLVGSLALCGVFPFSGFFSKDAILASVAENSPLIFCIGVLTTGLTTFYMSRLFIITFHGNARSEAAQKPKRVPNMMKIPLIILAIASLIVGFFGVEAFVHNPFEYDLGSDFEEHSHGLLASAFGFFAIIFGMSIACSIYLKIDSYSDSYSDDSVSDSDSDVDPIFKHCKRLSSILQNRFHLDELYAFLILIVHETLSKIAFWLDRKLIDGFLIRLTCRNVDLFGRTLRMLQTGNLQTYAFLLAVGIVAVIYFVMGAELL